MVNLKKAKEEDLSIIADLAKIIWNDHYIPIIGKTQVDYMLARIYNLESLKEQLNVKKHQFYLIRNEEKNLGFLSVSSENGHDYFLHKFYINQSEANKGIGTQALNLIIGLVNPHSITLTVNRQNYKSINFYFKNGFKIEKVEDFDIGNGFQMNDFVLKRVL